MANIIKTTELTYLEGFEHLRDALVKVSLFPEIGILSAPDRTFTQPPLHEEICEVSADGMIDSRLIAMTMNVKGELVCYYDEELDCYYWVQSETLLKDKLRALVMAN